MVLFDCGSSNWWIGVLFMEFCVMTIQEIQTKILNRYEQEGRKFPWRETTDPYKIHLCEVMSQQTQLSRVLVYWTKWLERFPDYEAVANASQKEILTYRSGL